MQLKVGNRIIEHYNQVSVSLKYDSVASTFSYVIYFDPYNANDRALFVPGNYNQCSIIHNGETLITGVLLNTGTRSSSIKELMRIGGYSKAGVMNDCQIPVSSYPIQLNNLSLKEIAEQIAGIYGLTVTIDPIVSGACDVIYTQQTFDNEQTAKDILSKLCTNQSVVFSHDATGNLLLTQADTTKTPIHYFDELNPDGTWTNIDLQFNGQGMHSIIWTVGQANIDTANGSEDSIVNPYVQTHLDWLGTARLSTIGYNGIAYSTGYRPNVSLQTSGNDNTTPLTARQLLAQELMNITLTIKIPTWTLGGKLVRPNNIITVRSPENQLYQKTKWFIQSVDFDGDEKSETAILNCVLPECYNSGDVVNVFTGSNLTVPIQKPVTGAHAVITPFI